jgi:DNA-binding response OmpR family regulator
MRGERDVAARILVVDDEPTPRMAITEALNLMGYDAAEAASGGEALDALSIAAYDLMLLDLRMPGMDGVEVMRRVRQTHPNLVIIVLTAYGTLESAIEAVRAGAADYLLKPSSIRDTEAAIARALQRRRKPSEVPFSAIAGALEGNNEPGPLDTPSHRFLQIGTLLLDREKNLVLPRGNGGVSVELTSSEAALLAYLVLHPDTVFSCRELARYALDYHLIEQEAREIIRPHISRLRQKIEPELDHPRLIRTVRGKGYLFSSSAALSWNLTSS